jgi:hypothetical protein
MIPGGTPAPDLKVNCTNIDFSGKAAKHIAPAHKTHQDSPKNPTPNSRFPSQPQQINHHKSKNNNLNSLPSSILSKMDNGLLFGIKNPTDAPKSLPFIPKKFQLNDIQNAHPELARRSEPLTTKNYTEIIEKLKQNNSELGNKTAQGNPIPQFNFFTKMDNKFPPFRSSPPSNPNHPNSSQNIPSNEGFPSRRVQTEPNPSQNYSYSPSKIRNAWVNETEGDNAGFLAGDLTRFNCPENLEFLKGSYERYLQHRNKMAVENPGYGFDQSLKYAKMRDSIIQDQLRGEQDTDKNLLEKYMVDKSFGVKSGGYRGGPGERAEKTSMHNNNITINININNEPLVNIHRDEYFTKKGSS